MQVIKAAVSLLLIIAKNEIIIEMRANIMLIFIIPYFISFGAVKPPRLIFSVVLRL